MAKGVAQFANDQDTLLSVGPFQGLDVTTSPIFIAQNNCVSQQNVAINRNYGSYVTQKGRTANYFGTALPGNNTYAIGIVNEIIQPAGQPYVPGVYVFNGNTGTGIAYYGGNGQAPVQVTNWATSNLVLDPIINPYDSKFVFAGTYAFVDCAYEGPQMIVPSVGLSPGTSAINWGITGPASAPAGTATGTGNLIGTYYYGVTFINSTLNSTIPIESSTSPFTTGIVTNTTGQQIALTGIPVSTDPQVTGRNIYRFGGTIGATALLVATINDNTTTTYTDNLADSAVTGQQLILRQDPAPAFGWQSICYHKGRMWGFGSKLGLSTTNVGQSDLWYSNYLQFTSFNSVTQVLDCGNDINDSGIAIASLDSILVALKQQSLWVCYGDSQNDFITRRTFSVGCVSRGSVAVGYGKLFWLGPDGVYMFDGADAPVNISDGNIPQGSIRTAIDAILTVPNNPTFVNDVGCFGFIVDRTYYISFYSQSGQFQTVTYGYDLESGAWTVLPYGALCFGVNRNVGYTGLVNEQPIKMLGSSLVLAPNLETPSLIDQWFAAETDFSNPVDANWTTGISDSGAIGLTKEYRFIEVVAPTQNATVTINLSVNPGTNATVLGPFVVNLATGTNRHRISLPTGTIGYECQLSIATSTLTKTIIDKVVVLGYIKRSLSPAPHNG